MKKVLFIALALVLCLCLSVGCFAQDEGRDVGAPRNGSSETPSVNCVDTSLKDGGLNTTPTAEGGIDIKAYIMDKIVPVAVAVLTSALAFIATLGTIAKSLKALKDTKDAFKDEAKERAVFFECGMEMLSEKAQELTELVSDVPKLKEELTELAQECRLNSEILALGFSANSEVIKSGKGKKMSILLENAKLKNAPSTASGPPPSTDGGLNTTVTTVGDKGEKSDEQI